MIRSYQESYKRKKQTGFVGDKNVKIYQNLRVKSKHISGEDVTEEYIDLTARLNNFERQEERLLEILDIAKTTKETLEVERFGSI